jgi:hypothetical protein
MADVGMQDRLQRLFEELSDHYPGLVECKALTPEYVDVQFLSPVLGGRHGSQEAGRAKLSLCNFTVNNTDLGGYLVRVVGDADEECFVSYLPSAIIAVVCR